MKRFLTETIITAIMAGAILVANGLLLNQIPLNNVYTFKHSYMEQHAGEIKTLVMGHSQMEWGLDPRALGDSAFCLAMSGRVSYYDEMLLKRYIHRMHNLETIIMPLHYAFDGFDGFYVEDKDRKDFIYHYFRDMHIPYPRYFYHYIPYHYKDLKHDGVPSGVDELGYRKLTEEFRGADTWWACTQGAQDLYRASLTEMAKLCEQHGVRLIVITPPSAQAHLNMTTEAGMNKLYAMIDSMKAQYPLEYRNYIADSMFRDNKLYHDATHLNHTGATLFAERIVQDFEL